MVHWDFVLTIESWNAEWEDDEGYLYILLRIVGLFDQLNEVKVFPQLDLTSRFHQPRVTEKGENFDWF